jgi:hypothetical protein
MKAFFFRFYISLAFGFSFVILNDLQEKGVPLMYMYTRCVLWYLASVPIPSPRVISKVQ